MTTRRLRLDRRALLRGTGAALALPFLEAMGDPLKLGAKAAHAANGFPKRVVFLFTPGGTETLRRGGGIPSGANGLTLGSVLAPLERHRADTIVLENIDNEAGHTSTEHRGDGAGHGSGGNLFTGTRLRKGGPFDDGDGYAVSVPGRSIDHVLGDRIGTTNAHRSLQLQIGPQPFEREGHMGTHLSWFGNNQWAPNEWRPDVFFTKVLANAGKKTPTTPAGDPAADLRRQRKKSVLDATLASYTDISARLGAADRARLDAHVTALREMEMKLQQAPAPAAPVSSCNPGVSPGVIGQSDANVPTLSRAFADQIALSFACDVSRVVMLQFSRCTSRSLFPYLGIKTNGWYHDWQHARLYPELAQVHTFYAEQVAYLADALKKIPEGAGTVFDNTLIVWAPELADSAGHTERGQHWVLVGSAGGALRTGRHLVLSRPGSHHNNLLLAILRLFDQPDTTFGDADLCSGPTPGLL